MEPRKIDPTHRPSDPGSEAEQPAAPAHPRRHLMAVGVVVLAGLVVALDQVTKALAVDRLTEGVPVSVVGDVLQLRLTRNAGAAFSLATGSTWIFTVVALAVVVVIIRVAARLGSRGWTIALGLLLGGATGNLTDRLLRPPSFGQGHVVDFIELPHWPIFNIADCCIVCAAVLIALLGVLGIRVDGGREARRG